MNINRMIKMQVNDNKCYISLYKENQMSNGKNQEPWAQANRRDTFPYSTVNLNKIAYC